MIKNLYALAEKSETIEELEGNVSEILELANERSWLLAYWSHRAKEISGLEGVRRLSNSLPISANTCRQYAEVWNRFGGIKREYPRLSFSYFLTCYQVGLEGGKAIKALDMADKDNIKTYHFRNMLRGKHKKHRCKCPVCGSDHIKR